MKSKFFWTFSIFLTIVFTQLFIYYIFGYDSEKLAYFYIDNSNGDTESGLSSQHDELINYLCPKSSVDFDHVMAFNEVKNDLNKLKPIYDACNSNIKPNEMVEIVRDENNLENYTLKLNVNSFKKFYNKTSFSCLIQRFDKKVNSTESKNQFDYFDQNFQLDSANKYKVKVKKHGFYFLNCTNNTNHTIFSYVYNVLPTNMSLLIQKRKIHKKFAENLINNNIKVENTVKDKMYKNNYINENCSDLQDNNITILNQKMNVLIIGIDALSNLQFKRVFPLTYIYLRDLLKGNLIFDNFNSNGENSYPNMMALFNGIATTDLNEYGFRSELNLYKKYDSDYQDSIPFIWNDFEDMGYLTMYQEDSPSISTFNLGKGFRFYPTHLYGRGYWTKYYKIRTGPKQCHYKYHTFLTFFNFLDSFIQQMNSDINKDLGYFSFNYLNEYTHDDMYLPQELDISLRDLIAEYESKGYLDNTFFMVYGDHGVRLKSYGYSTDQGKIEKNNPFVSIRLPKVLRTTRYFQNALNNKNKLVTFFDVFQTLRQFLYINKYGIQKNDSECYDKFRINDVLDRNKRGISIFENINMNRSCQHGFIPLDNCNCILKVKLKQKEFEKETKYYLEDAVSIIIDSLNKITDSNRSLCSEFKYKSLKSIDKIKIANTNYYSINLLVSPGDAWFEGILKIDQNFKKKTKKIKLILNGLPKRLSIYKYHSYCVSDKFLAKYCFCN